MTRNLALVGCGAIAQMFYLPAIAKRRDQFGDVWLVEPNERVRTVASLMIDANAVRDFSELPDNVTLVIIAAPNKYHCSLAREALQRSAHVLLEKPFAIWPHEGASLIEAAVAANRVVAVNQTRRFMPFAQDLQGRIAAGDFGAFVSASHFEGQKLRWPFESGVAFNRAAQRTGVIMDLGVHVIDFYEYMLTPEWVFVSAIHDGFQGPEGLAEIRLEANCAPISVRLSRYYKQENVAHLKFEKAEVSINLEQLNSYTIREQSGQVHFMSASHTVGSYNELADRVIANFLDASEGRAAPICSTSASIPVIKILDEIYNSAQLYPSQLGAV